jgi:N-acetylglucosaminyl-diphospho-decaprenol L-rhamnosyltransferase
LQRADDGCVTPHAHRLRWARTLTPSGGSSACSRLYSHRMSRVQAVIVSYNSRETLRHAVELLWSDPEVEVTVVDNASSDQSLETVVDLPIRILELPENRGFAAACNEGWRAGSAPSVLFLNPDARIERPSVSRMADLLEASLVVGAVAPRIVDGEGNLDFSLRRFPRLRSTYAQALFLHRLFPKAAWSDEVVRDTALYERPTSPQWASGACLMVRRSALEKLGGFDERFFMYCEDIDLCLRLRNAGYEVRYAPMAIALHEGGGFAPRPTLLPTLASSRIAYARAHADRVRAFLERVGIGLGALTHLAFGRGGTRARAGHARAFLVALGLELPRLTTPTRRD